MDKYLIDQDQIYYINEFRKIVDNFEWYKFLKNQNWL